MLTIKIPRWSVFALAIVTFLGFWGLALSGSLPTPPNESNASVHGLAVCTSHDCIQDAASQTVALYTEVLAWFTIVLAIASVAQGVFLFRADQATRMALEVSAKIAADNTNFNQRQINISGMQNDTLIAQKEIARQQYLATFRPHLIVRNVHSLGADPGDEMLIKFEVINNGLSKAQIVASEFEVNFVRSADTFRRLHLPMVGESPAKNVIGEIALIPSAVYRGEFRPPQVWQADHFHSVVSLEAGFFFGGKILYRDIEGRQRRLGVYRRFDPSSRRFRSVNDPEFEYDD